eukprot:7390787-Prymnesium_polylepis.1
MATDTNRLKERSQVLAHLVAGQRCVLPCRPALWAAECCFASRDAPRVGCKQLYQRRIVRKREPTSSAGAPVPAQDVRVLWPRRTKLDELDQ